MAARNKPYEQFGPYILFKKLEQDSLGDLWRAGQITGGQIGPALAVRRLSGGDRTALGGAVEAVAQLLPRLTGTSFARDQVAGIHEGIPFLAWDYAGGRSLRHIMERSRGGKEGAAPNPLPIDQAIVIAERVALSLATTGDMRDTTGARLSHGTLLPQFVWVSDDGEIRVAGQQLSSGIVASLASPAVAADIGRYVAPEFRSSGQAPKNADVYAMGALLFLVITGQEPPDAMTASAFVSAVRAAKTTTGAPIPDDIRVILDKSFNLDPSMRFAAMSEMKQALSALAHGGKYSATTFNLAFYLSNLLKKDMEIETAEREKEAKLNLAPYLEQPKPAPVAAQPLPAAVVMPAFDAPSPEAAPAKSRLPLAAAALVVLAAAGGGAWMLFGRTPASPGLSGAATAALVPATPAPKPVSIPEPIVAAGSTETAGDAIPSTTGDPADPEAQKRAFEAAVRQKLQAEMMKLQSDYMSELQKQQSRNAPVAAATPPASAQQALSPEERATLSAAQLDQQRREASSAAEAATETRAPVPAPAVAQTQTAAPAPVQAAAPAPAPPPAVREGDVIDYSELDVVPRATRAIAPVYPPLARQQRISATVVVTALIDESGEVTDVKVLRGNGRYGIDEAAVRAVRAARFTSPMKSGKRVKTWIPQTIQFKP